PDIYRACIDGLAGDATTVSFSPRGRSTRRSSARCPTGRPRRAAGHSWTCWSTRRCSSATRGWAARPRHCGSECRPCASRGPPTRWNGCPARMACVVRTLADLDRELIDCRACPRLVEWREHVAVTKRAAFADEMYWGRPVPGFGPADARLVIVGLAPAAHGAN